MKKFALIIIAILLVALTVTAYAGVGGNITADRGFTPSVNSTIVVTKGSATVLTTTIAALRYQCSAACTYTFNGAGDSWAVAANTPEIIYVPSNVRSVVFTAPSSAGTTYRFQKH